MNESIKCDIQEHFYYRHDIMIDNMSTMAMHMPYKRHKAYMKITFYRIVIFIIVLNQQFFYVMFTSTHLNFQEKT